MYLRAISSDTLVALQIIQSASHPVSHNQGLAKISLGSKEGLSIYGLLYHLAHTPQGRMRLRQRLLRPSFNLETMKQCHDIISAFLREENSMAVDEMIKSLKRIKNLDTVMIHLRKGLCGARPGGRGGIRQGVWGSIHQVRALFIPRSYANLGEVCILRHENQRSFDYNCDGSGPRCDSQGEC